MAFEEMLTFNRTTGIAAADLSSKQYYAITDGSGGMNVATATKACDGILQDNPASGKAGSYARAGITKAAISANSVLTAGVTMLEVDTGGTLKPVASGTIVAKTKESLASTASVCIVAVELLPSNALFS